MAELASEGDVFWLVGAATLVTLMQGGFCLMESGLVRAKNKINVGAKNLVDFCTAGLVFWAVGYGLMFGSGSALVGTSGFLFGGGAEPWDYAFVMFQMTFAGTAATIVSGAVAERIRFSRYLVLTLFISAVVYPVYGHWVWGGLGPGADAGWLSALGFVDVAGGTVVHATAGWAALAVIIVIGPRQGRFSRSQHPIEGHDLTIAIFGVLLLWVGWFGFNGGSMLGASPGVALVLLNTNLSACAGGLAGLALARTRGPVIDLTDVMNGVIGGLVATTAGAPHFTPNDAVAVGLVGGATTFGGVRLLRRLQLDDAIGAVPAHAFAGVWGALAVAVLGDLDSLGTGLSRSAQVAAQLTGVAVGFGWAFGLPLAVLLIINRLFPFRVSTQDEWIGLNVTEHGATTPAAILLQEMERHHQTNSPAPVTVEPFTEVGLIAAQYNTVVARVIAEQRRTDQLTAKVKQAHQEVLAILESAGEGICGISAQGHITFINEAGARLLSREPSDMIGKIAHEILHSGADGTCSQHTCPIALVLADGQPRQIGNDGLVTAEGTHLPVASVTAPIWDGQDRVAGAVVTYRDLRLQKELETKLLQAQKLEAIGALAAGVAHEINTPMQYIGDNTHFLRATLARLLEVAEAAGRAVATEATEDDRQRLAQLVEKARIPTLATKAPRAADDTLSGVADVSRIVAALKRFSHPGGDAMAPVDLNSAIASTITICRSEWKYVADVQTNFQEDLPLVEGSVGALNQVWLNMIVNAAHAIADRPGDDKGLIEIETSSIDNGSGVCVTIRDDGSGIPVDDLGRIFDQFFTTKEVGKGTGQGLAIAHQVIVNEHQGKIEVETAVDTGTAFMVTLPVFQSAAQEEVGTIQ